jgi:peptidylprolyl isomerase
MNAVKEGDKVKVHYTGTLREGTVFDSSKGREPLEFTVGEHHVIPGFESAVVGMTTGDTKTETIPADEAYGPRREEMLLKVEREQFPDHITPEVGLQLQMTTPEGQPVPVRISGLSEGTIELDANHPLAGEDLTFELELVEIAS